MEGVSREERRSLNMEALCITFEGVGHQVQTPADSPGDTAVLSRLSGHVCSVQEQGSHLMCRIQEASPQFPLGFGDWWCAGET